MDTQRIGELYGTESWKEMMDSVGWSDEDVLLYLGISSFNNTLFLEWPIDFLYDAIADYIEDVENKIYRQKLGSIERQNYALFLLATNLGKRVRDISAIDLQPNISYLFPGKTIKTLTESQLETLIRSLKPENDEDDEEGSTHD